MIPLKLQLKNFLSFGSDIQTIDFTPYPLICLSGKNGHGKSALLDALTWALWGQARKMSGVAKSDDAMVRIGQTHMMVGLQFMCNGQEYRVRREYTKSTGKPYVTLDVGVLDTTQNVFIPIGGKSIRSNQAALEDLIHLDFDSFCNSAFLRQGQSNEFSKKSPKERKEILASILGLNAYESIRALASERARAAATDRISIQAILDRMMQDLSRVAALDERLHALDTTFAHIQEKEREVVVQEQQLTARRDTVRKMQQTVQMLDMQIDELQKNRQEATVALQDVARQWRTVHAQQLQIPAMATLTDKKNKIVEQLHIHQQAMHASLVHKEQYLAQKEYIHTLEVEHAQTSAVRLQEYTVQCERSKIELEHYKSTLVASQAKRKELDAEQAVVQKDLQALQERHVMITIDQVRQQACEKQFEKRKAYYQNWVTLGNVLTSELHNLERKKQLSQDETNPCCPLCEQNLSASRRRFLKDKFLHEEQFLRHRIDRLARVIKKLKDLLIEQHAQLAVFNKQLEELQKLGVSLDATKAKVLALAQEIDACQQQQAICEKQIALFTAAAATQEKELADRQEAMKASLKDDQRYAQAVAQLRILEKAMADTLCDGTKHNELQQELASIDNIMQAYDEFTKQIALQETRQEQVHALVLRLKKSKKDIEKLYAQKNEFKSIHAQEVELAQAEQELSRCKLELNKQKELLLQERGGLERERTTLKALEKEADGCKKQIADIHDRIDDYQAIATATGKDGIQALLIQDILPEIEQEANALLAKLTDNQAQIFIESLRDLKKGGAKETLDINISDVMGIRPYEMFSGGEAFRIDFALRIALSKMLARRAGTSLQTLIIDEGFGSQDEEGLAHIMDALYKIQDDFAKVIIVSHLTSMKDQFPVHFYVEKKPSGSTVNVVEQG